MMIPKKQQIVFLLKIKNYIASFKYIPLWEMIGAQGI